MRLIAFAYSPSVTPGRSTTVLTFLFLCRLYANVRMVRTTERAGSGTSDRGCRLLPAAADFLLKSLRPLDLMKGSSTEILIT